MARPHTSPGAADSPQKAGRQPSGTSQLQRRQSSSSRRAAAPAAEQPAEAPRQEAGDQRRAQADDKPRQQQAGQAPGPASSAAGDSKAPRQQSADDTASADQAGQPQSELGALLRRPQLDPSTMMRSSARHRSSDQLTRKSAPPAKVGRAAGPQAVVQSRSCSPAAGAALGSTVHARAGSLRLQGRDPERGGAGGRQAQGARGAAAGGGRAEPARLHALLVRALGRSASCAPLAAAGRKGGRRGRSCR